MSLQLLLASSSRCHPQGYLDHGETEFRRLFADVSEVLFVPYARPGGRSHAEYTAAARERFERAGQRLKGIEEFANPRDAMATAQGVFVGGGNTFVLLRDLYHYGLVEPLRERITAGMAYMGTSAGSTIAGLTIGTSNDMPIVHPPSFAALAAVPFNINPHFPLAKPDPTHKGETREDRLGEFHVFNKQPVVALHEDGMLRIEGSRTLLIGRRPALVFQPDQDVVAIEPGPVPQTLLRGSGCVDI